MIEQEKRDLEIETLEATEIEDEDLEDVSGGTTNNNCNCSVSSN